MNYLDLRKLAKELKELKLAEEPDCDMERLNALIDLNNQFPDGMEAAAKEEQFLISESDWEEYCEYLAIEVGYLGRGSPLTNFVDWSGWAQVVSHDYKTYVFDGEVYYHRRS